MNKIAVIGCGNVGMAYAYALTISNLPVDEIVLIDIVQDKIEGEAMDLSHSAIFRNNKCKIYAGSYVDCCDAKIVVISAGRNQNIGETRTDLIDKNVAIFNYIISSIKESGFDGIYLIATNPLDVMTYVTLKLSNTTPNKVIGSGTTLDTARLKSLISDKTSIDPDNIHAFVIGEHGDSEMIPWSLCRIGLNQIDEFLTDKDKENLLHTVRQSAYEIIKRKGNTAYGIGMCLMKITEAILNDDNTIMTVSTYDENNKIYYGYPSVINANGAIRQVDIALTTEEKIQLENSINQIKSNIKHINM